MNNIVEAVFGTCNPYECATRILYRYDYGMILTFPDLELPTAYEVHFSNYDDVGTTITQIGNEDGVSIPDEFLQTGLPVYCWVYLHTWEDDGETVYKVTINVQDRPQPSNGTPTPVQQDAITEAIAALDSAVEQTGADASSANADALKSEGYAVGTQDGEPVEQGSPYYRHNSLWLSQQAGQSANKAEAQASLSEAWAVGEISGHPVSSDYPQYENNSKYYARQASQSAEDAEESAQSVLGLTADATVDSNVGTPSVSVSVTTESDHKNMSFAFHNLKGVQGDPGDTGVGISSVVLNADYTLTITLTNGTSYTTTSIRGEVGATPNLTIGTVSTLPEGSQATATITGTDEDPVLNLGIPIGDTGDPGVSPTITVTEITGGHEVAVTDAQGTQTFNVMDGQSGLITDYVAEEKTPYLFRPSANRLANVISEKDELIGGTVAWNQLLENGNFESTDKWISTNGSLSASNNELTYTISQIGSAYYTNQVHTGIVPSRLNIPSGHVVFLHAETFVPYNNGFYMSVRTNQVGQSGVGITNVVPTPNAWSAFSKIGKLSNVCTDIAFYWSMNTNYSVGDSVKLRNCYIIDLTQMFGSTIADYLYTLESGSSGSGIAKLKEWGFLQKSYYPYNSGELMSVQTSAHVMRDADDNVIGNYPLDSDLVLRGTLKLDAQNNLYYYGDTYESNGTVTRRYGSLSVDISSLSYTAETGNTRYYSTTQPFAGTYKLPSINADKINAICDKLGVYAYNSLATNSGIAVTSTGRIGISPDVYSAISNYGTVNFVAELATPTTETADPFAQYQIVDADGTEEYVDERTVPIPVGHDTFYQQAVDVPQLPTTDGAYRLALSLTGNTATASWEYVAQAEMVAQTNIPSGKYFSVGERLFVSTQAIAQGANIVVGTNCLETTLADALNSINS